MFVMSLDFADTKTNKNIPKGMTYRIEEVFDWIFNDSESDKGDSLSENESKDKSWSQTIQ